MLMATTMAELAEMLGQAGLGWVGLEFAVDVDDVVYGHSRSWVAWDASGLGRAWRGWGSQNGWLAVNGGRMVSQMHAALVALRRPPRV